MNLQGIEKERLRLDENLDGFSDFVEIMSYRDYRIVHRDVKNWQGVIDNMDNIVLPLIYDNIEIVDYGFKVILNDTKGQSFVGLVDVTDMRIVIPPYFKTLIPLDNGKMIWTLDAENNWFLYDCNGALQEKLSTNCMPLTNSSNICILRKNHSCDFSIECWDQNMTVSQQLLRSLALDSEFPGRIILNNEYYHAIVYCDIYGRVLYSNINLDTILTM